MDSCNDKAIETFGAWRKKIMESAVASYTHAAGAQPQQNGAATRPQLKIRIKLPPLAACGVVKKPDGTCTVNPIRGSGKQMKLIRAAFLKHHLAGTSPEPKPATEATERKQNGEDRRKRAKPNCSSDHRGKINDGDRRGSDSLGVKSPSLDTDFESMLDATKSKVYREKPNGSQYDCLEIKQRLSGVDFERKLEGTKSKLHHQYRSIEDRRKRIVVVSDIPAIPPVELNQSRRRRWG